MDKWEHLKERIRFDLGLYSKEFDSALGERYAWIAVGRGQECFELLGSMYELEAEERESK
ncbi:MAG: hypothetical protein DDT19_01768 [Syntrophomonadaceae bacterium]|nr:hypothetical protein [Bacillota bacterium]